MSYFQLSATLAGHELDVKAVRGPTEDLIISSSRDKTVRLWSRISSNTFGEDKLFLGHTHFVNSVAYLRPTAEHPNGLIVSGSSDKVINVYDIDKSQDPVYTLFGHKDNICALDVTPSGYIVSGSWDNNQIGDLKKDELPGPEALNAPGKSEGQVIMVRVRDAVEAHQWSQKDNKWHKIGDVVDAVGQGRKQLYNGREYDYLFDVDIGEGVPPLKLPYNVADNPYKAAQEFIQANELPQGYLDQVADFIVKNTKGVSLGSGSQFYDPLTGGSTRNPSYSSSPSSTVPSQNTFATGIDPWTRPALSPNTSEPTRVIPQKINQLNQDLQDSDSTNDSVLSTKELTALEDLIKFLQNPTFKSSSTADRQSEFAVIHKIVSQWPSANRFPGIDLLRLLILYSPIPAQYDDIDGSIVSLLIDSADIRSWDEGNSPTKEQETNTMLGLRALANLFDNKEGKEVLRRKAQTIIELISPILGRTTNKNLRIALVTVFLNFSVEFRTNPDEDATLQIIATLAEELSSETDSEVLYRSIVTLGTAISNNQAAKEAAEIFNVKDSVKLASTKMAEARITQVT
ncbi:11364_t:CDS:10, partial [Acaulospora colombiana]